MKRWLCPTASEKLDTNQQGEGVETKQREKTLCRSEVKHISSTADVSPCKLFHTASRLQLHPPRLRAISGTPNLPALHPAPRTMTVIPTG